MKNTTNFHAINTERSKHLCWEEVCSLVEPCVVVIRSSGTDQSLELRQTVDKSLCEEHGFFKLDINSLIRDENERRTELGLQIAELMAAGKLVSADLMTRLLQKIIYSGVPNADRFLLIGFPDVREQADEFEKKCCGIKAIIYTSGNECPQVEIKNENLNNFSIDAVFAKFRRLKSMKEWSYSALQEQLNEKVFWGFVSGRPLAGKSTVANIVSGLKNGHVISMKDIAEQTKKRLADPESGEFEGDLPLADVEKDTLAHIAACRNPSARNIFIFDGYMHASPKDFCSWADCNLGAPSFWINCCAEADAIGERWSKANEDAEVGDDQKEQFEQESAAAKKEEEDFDCAME